MSCEVVIIMELYPTEWSNPSEGSYSAVMTTSQDLITHLSIEYINNMTTMLLMFIIATLVILIKMENSFCEKTVVR